MRFRLFRRTPKTAKPVKVDWQAPRTAKRASQKLTVVTVASQQHATRRQRKAFTRLTRATEQTYRSGLSKSIRERIRDRLRGTMRPTVDDGQIKMVHQSEGKTRSQWRREWRARQAAARKGDLQRALAAVAYPR